MIRIGSLHDLRAVVWSISLFSFLPLGAFFKKGNGKSDKATDYALLLHPYLDLRLIEGGFRIH